MGNQPESNLSYAIQKALKKEAARRGHKLFIFKVHGNEHMMAGLPDMVACYRGMFIGLEAKMPGNDTSPRQVYVHRKIREAEGLVLVPYSVAEALKALDLVDQYLEPLIGR
jgi:hypothetical protein